MSRKRFAIVGASRRGWAMYAVPITRDYAETAELAALCDISQTHMDVVNRQLAEPVATFTDFGEMIEKAHVDTVIVTTMDSFHDVYVVKALRAGKDAIVEKPMATDEEKCRGIIRAERETGRKVTVTFNCRFLPSAVAIRRMIADGLIGDVISVDLHWPLSLTHGPSYFRRWHRIMANSGGLQVHKATHHFDLVNWWLQDEPATVTARGGLDFYGRNGPFRGKRCKGCPHAQDCAFYWDIMESEITTEFYVAAEEETGYIRDGCVFDESIDIQDHFSLLATYKGGATLAYSLQAWSSWEGLRLEIQGTKGRLEYLTRNDVNGEADPASGKIMVALNDGTRIAHTPPAGVGGHGGGDRSIKQMLFEPGHDDPLGQMSGARGGALSVLLGVAATKSMENHGAGIRIADLLEEK